MKGLYRCVFVIAIIFISVSTFGQTFTSVIDGNWNDGATWGNASPGLEGTDYPSASHNAIIATNVTVPASYGASITNLTVSAGIMLTVSNTGSLSLNGILTLEDDGLGGIGFLEVYGTVTANQGSSFVGDASSTVNFYSTGVYQHNFTTSAGNIIGAMWNSGSSCRVIGYTSNTSAPGNLNQNFHHFTWNCPNFVGGGTATAFINLAGALTTVNGNLTVSHTGGSSRTLRLYDNVSSITTNITGNLVIEGSSRLVFSSSGTGNIVNITGNFTFSNTATSINTIASTGSCTVNVTGSFSHSTSSGTSTLNLNSTTTPGTGTLNVKGNFSLGSGCTIARSSSAGGAADIIFNGSSLQTFSSSGTFSNAINFSVASGSIVDLGSSSLTGTGTFTNNGILRVGSTDASGAIQNNTTGGNIRVGGARTYASGSTIVYNGSSAQFTGDGHPTTSNVHTTINNSSGVTLAANLTITGNLTLTSGNLSLGSNTLTLDGNFTPNSNFLNVASASSLTINGIGAFGTLTTTGSTTINNFTINRSTSGTVTLGTDLTISGTLTQTVGDLVLNGRTLTISGPYTRTNGSLNVDAASTLIVSGTGALPVAVTFAGNQALNTLTVSRAATTLATNSSLTITNLNLFSGTFDNTGTITMATGGVITRTEGSIINNTPSATTSYDLVYNIASDITTGSEIPASASALRHVTKTGGAQLTLNQALTINGDLTLSNGVFNAGTFTINMKGNFVANAVSTLTSSPVTFSGTTFISGGSPVQFGSVTVTGTLTPTINIRINGDLVNNGTLMAGSATTTFGGTSSISGTGTTSFNNIVINSASTLTAPTGSMNVAGSFTNNGTFNRNSGTVVFNGTTDILGTSSTDFANITISGTLNAPATLNVTRNFVNNGTFNRGTGTVVFKGTVRQSISGSAVTDFNNINVTNTAGPPSVEVLSNQNLRGTLTLASNSIFDADGAGSAILTLISTSDDPTTDAGIATLPSGANVTGSVTVQRYMAIEGSTSRIYRYISSPVQSAAVSQIQTEIPVTGTFTGTSTCSGCGTNQSMFSYNESIITGDLNTGYEDFPASANTETLALGKGYAIYVRGNVEPVLSAGSARWDVRSPINSGVVNFPVSFSSSGNVSNDGWNLIGNPYPSTIDWNASTGWTKSADIGGTIYMKDNGSNGIYATWNGTTSVNGGSRYIAMGQAFWVKSDGSASTALSANEQVKTAGTQTSFFRTSSPSDLLRITLRQGNVRDETVIHFREDATENYDHRADAYKLRNQNFNLSTITSEKLKLAINSLPLLSCGRTVKLDISDVKAGTYTLEFSEFESFREDVGISFYDVFTDTRLDAREKTTYDFEVTSDSASFGPERFSVLFSYKAPAEALIDAPSEVCSGQGALIQIQNSEPYVAYAVYRDGVAVTDAVNGNGGSLNILLDGALLSPGENGFALRYFPSDCSLMISSKQINISSLGLAQLTTSDGSHCGTGSVSITASGAEEGNYRWYESEADERPIPGATSATYVTPVLNKTKTYYVSAVNVLGCEGSRKLVTAVINQYTELTISVNDDQNTLTSNYDAGNQWYFDGKEIPGATGKNLKADKTGLYEAEVRMANGCSTRASLEMIVLSIEEGNGDGVNIFPNPVIGKLTIDLPQTGAAMKGTVYSSSGQPLGSIKFKSNGINLTAEYDFGDQPAGVYVVRLKQGNKTMHYKIVKK